MRLDCALLYIDGKHGGGDRQLAMSRSVAAKHSMAIYTDNAPQMAVTLAWDRRESHAIASPTLAHEPQPQPQRTPPQWERSYGDGVGHGFSL